MNIFVNQSQNGKFSKELHALRGIAALVVFLVHFQHRLLDAWPELHVPDFFNGSAAVTYFFVLSGLVVGISLAKSWGENRFLLIYGIRRIFRIMPLMVVMATIGGLYLFFINAHMPYSLYDVEKYGDFDWKRMMAGYIGYSMKSNPPSWSIFVELMGSALIPLFILCGRSKLWIILGAIILFSFSIWDMPIKNKFNIFMLSFYAGLSVLIWGKYFAQLCEKLPTPAFWLAVSTLLAGFYLPRVITQSDYYGNPWIVHWETLCVTPLIALVYYVPHRFSVLTRPIFQFFGDISFGLYLTHFLMMVTLYNVLILCFGVNIGTIGIFCVLSPVLAIILAKFSYRYIEQPGMVLGKKMVGILKNGQKTRE
ncbi:MAG: acyltransferase [Alphaproteobacteria bacterium]|nr:acyltransferase [Alphaproteobacteria bacterium]